MRLLLAFLLLLPFEIRAASFTDFYVQTTGNNLNSGHTADDSATYTAANGNWDGTSVYTPTDGSTPASTVTNNSWASIYLDAATVGVYVGRVTNVAAGVNGAITLDRACFAGTPPASGANGRSIKVGGAWQGPNTNANPSVAFPFGFAANTMTNSTGFAPCVNFKDQMYSTTNAITAGNAGNIMWSGYHTSPRDGLGRATIDGTFAGTSFTLINFSGGNNTIQDFVFDHNGTASGTTFGLSTAAETVCIRVTVRNMVRDGFRVSASTLISCEAYNCNTANNSGSAGFQVNSSGNRFVNCLSYSNTTANSIGFVVSASDTAYGCIAYYNGNKGFSIDNTLIALLAGCTSYKNGSHGFDLINATALSAPTLINCDSFANGGYGVACTGSATKNGFISNITFGSGTKTNTSGNFGPNLTNWPNITLINNTLIYTADLTPWTDPDRGNFRLVSGALSKAAGYGAFMQSTVNSPTNTVSFPDTGAVQSASTNVAGGSWTFSQ